MKQHHLCACMHACMLWALGACMHIHMHELFVKAAYGLLSFVTPAVDVAACCGHSQSWGNKYFSLCCVFLYLGSKLYEGTELATDAYPISSWPPVRVSSPLACLACMHACLELDDTPARDRHALHFLFGFPLTHYSELSTRSRCPIHSKAHIVPRRPPPDLALMNTGPRPNPVDDDKGRAHVA